MTNFHHTEQLQRVAFPYIEILEILGKEQIFFAGWMGENLEFNFVHVNEMHARYQIVMLSRQLDECYLKS